MGGNGHDSAGAVGGQDVVGDEDGDLLVVHRVDGPDALQFHAGLFLDQLGALEVGLGGGHADVFGHFVIVGQLVLPLFHIGVLGGDDHVSRAKEGVAAGGVDGEDVAFGGVEVHVSAGGAADPVLLLGHHTGQEVNGIQTVDELLGVSGDLQHPLALFLPDDFRAAALADAVDHFFVGQDALTAGAPVDGHGGLVGQALFEHLEEDPLGPFVVLGVGGVDDPIPVEGVAQHMQLAGEVLDVGLGDYGRVHMVLDGKVLGGQPEGVIPDGEEDIVAVHPLLSGDDVHSGVGTGVTHVEACTGGIGKLHQAVELGLALDEVLGLIGLFFLPLLLPFLLNGAEIILHLKSRLYIIVYRFKNTLKCKIVSQSSVTL